MRDIVDCKSRKIRGVYVYTGIVRDADIETFKKENIVSYPKGGYYVSLVNFYSGYPVPDDRKFITVGEERSKETNAAYRGAQFIKNKTTGEVAWLYYISLNRLDQFTHFKSCIDFNIIDYILGKNGYVNILRKINSEELYSNTSVIYFYYNKDKNMVVRVATDLFTRNRIRICSPDSIESKKIIFTNKSYNGVKWDYLEFEKMVRMSSITEDDLKIIFDSINSLSV